MTLKGRIKELANQKGISLPTLESELGFGNSTIVKWDKSTPNAEKLNAVAKYFGVSMDYLLNGVDEDGLSEKDNKDIARRLESTLEELENSQDGLMFSGEPLDDETRELLKASLENSIRIAKINAKQKFTPKKYRKDQ